jgi:arylsulfatase A-like enzyme
VLITVESLRPEHLGCYGCAKPTSPALDALARESTIYEDAHAVTSWTLASHASLFTGLYPTAHGAVGPMDRLGDVHETLAEMLSAAGYRTAGFAGGPYLRRAHNLHQGFEHYDDHVSAETHEEAHDDVTNAELTDTVLGFLRERRDRDRPLFLFVYYWDPHYDYIPPPPYDSLFVGPADVAVDVTDYGITDKIGPLTSPAELSYVLARYDGEIRWTDEHLGRLLDALREAGLWDDALIIVTADHGEEFFEHGTKGHKNNLFVESVHVPLLVKYPGGGRTGRDGRLVSLVDVAPTVLELAGAHASRPLHGRSLLEPAPPLDRDIYFELMSVWYHATTGGETREPWYAVREGDLKLVTVPRRGEQWLFDVGDDPGERHSLLPERADLAAALQQKLDAWRQEMELVGRYLEPGGPAELDPEELERLRALGYVGR